VKDYETEKAVKAQQRAVDRQTDRQMIGAGSNKESV
jgi:hypothetical protein